MWLGTQDASGASPSPSHQPSSQTAISVNPCLQKCCCTTSVWGTVSLCVPEPRHRESISPILWGLVGWGTHRAWECQDLIFQPPTEPSLPNPGLQEAPGRGTFRMPSWGLSLLHSLSSGGSMCRSWTLTTTISKVSHVGRKQPFRSPHRGLQLSRGKHGLLTWVEKSVLQ